MNKKRKVNSSRFWLLFLLVWTLAIPAPAQVPELINNPQFRPDAQAAVDSIYNFNFDGAEKQLSSWKEKYPQHPLWTLLDGMKFWWEVLSDLDDTSHDEQFYHMMKKADYEAGKLLHDDPSNADGLIIKVISNGYIARQYSNRSEWVTSLNYARKALSAYNYLKELQPGLADLKLAEGLKLYYSAYLPEEYPIVKTVSWFLPEGDKQKGLRLLREASTQAIFARAEAKYFLGNISYNYENNYGIAVRYFEQLQRQYPRNNYYTRILVKSYYKQHRFGEALRFIDKTLERWNDNHLPHEKVMQEELLTWKGQILERRGALDKALACYKEAFAVSKGLPNTQSRSFYVVSGYWAGKILHEQQKNDESRSYLKDVTKASAESTYRHKAKQLLSKMK
ncbi:MAG: hypothetical protein PVH63_08920 [Balneolaceae bacterium]